MLDLIGSSEFGDWLLNEIALLSALEQPDGVMLLPIARRRLDRLEAAKAALQEFMVMQQALLDTAREAREAHEDDWFFVPGVPGRPL